MYKGKKYTFLCIFMILIISVTVGLSAGFVEDKKVSQENIGQEEIVVLPDIMEEEKVEPEEFVPAPVFTNGYQAINYALDVLENGKGFSSYFRQSITTMGQTQQVVTKKYRSGNLNLAQDWYYIDFFVGENEYRCFYSDGTNMKIKYVTNRDNFNFQDLSYKTCAPDKLEQFPYSDWTGVKGRQSLNSFFTEVNSSTSRILYFDKSSDKQNYIVKLQMNTDNVDCRYLRTITDNGASNVSFNQFTLTFYINKSTGYFTKIVKNEIMVATYAGFENVECKNTSTEIFTAMNVDLTEKIKQEVDANYNY